MKLRFGLCRALVTAVAFALSGTAAPAFEWQTDSPEAHGLSTARLDGVRDGLATHGTKAFLLIKDDRIVYEWYADGHSATKTHFTASMAKALVGGVSVAVALSDGRFTLDDPVAKFVPQWRDDPLKRTITFRHLGSHTSGLDDAEDDLTAHDKLSGWKGDFWKRLPPPRDPFTLARDVVPVRFKPGTAQLYSNPGIAMLSYATTTALKATGAPEQDLRALLRDRVMRPIGTPDNEWSVGYGGPMEVEGLALVGSWGGAAFTARATARVARLMLREGNWDGRQLIKPEAVRAVTTDPEAPPRHGGRWISHQTGSAAIGWWRNLDGVVRSLPRDAYWGAGAQHQIVLVIPSLRLIAVRNGGALSAVDYDAARNTYFFQPLMEAVRAGQ